MNVNGRFYILYTENIHLVKLIKSSFNLFIVINIRICFGLQSKWIFWKQIWFNRYLDFWYILCMGFTFNIIGLRTLTFHWSRWSKYFEFKSFLKVLKHLIQKKQVTNSKHTHCINHARKLIHFLFGKLLRNISSPFYGQALALISGPNQVPNHF